jgi:D-alanine-D-alanine ligase
MSRIRIALLAGGWSGERGISLKSGEAVWRALDRSKYDTAMYDPRNDLQSLIDARGKTDLAFILLHGKYGEDGRIQGLLDILGIPFVGSGVLSSAMAVNKKVAKEVYRTVGLGTAKDVMLREGHDFSVERVMEMLGSATVVKPVDEGSSLGMSVCQTKGELLAGIDMAFQCSKEIMVEEYIDGREVTCCVLGNRKLQPLPVIEIVLKAQHRFFDYEAKYTPGATQEICPAPLSSSLTKGAQSCAIKAHKALKCSVWSRTDMIIRGKGIYLLETNTIPGMTENSLFPLAARTAGLSFSELLDKLIALSLTAS